eukprot:31438-Eustigmatos_ZCMA.PRE.1
MMPFTGLFDEILRRHETYAAVGPVRASELVQYRDYRYKHKHKQARLLLEKEMLVSIFLSTDMNDEKD